MNENPYSISEFGLKAQLAEVRREINTRRVVFSKRVWEKRMTQDEADRRLTAMEAVAQTLIELAAKEDEGGQRKLL